MKKSIWLTRGSLEKAIRDRGDEGKILPLKPLLQILGFKKIVAEGVVDRYRLHVSDGEISYSYAMLATELNKFIETNLIEPFAVIRVDKMICHTMNDKRIIIFLSVEVIAPGKEVGEKLGNPFTWNEHVAVASASATVDGNIHQPSHGHGLANSDCNNRIPCSNNCKPNNSNDSESTTITKSKVVVKPIPGSGSGLGTTTVEISSSVSLTKLFDEIQSLRNTFFFAKMGGIELTRGYLAKAIRGEETPLKPLLQILGFRKVVAQEGQDDRYRLHVSDGEFSYSFATLAPPLNSMIEDKIIEEFAVIRIEKMLCDIMNNRRILIILSLKVIVEGRKVREKLGNPVAWIEKVGGAGTGDENSGDGDGAGNDTSSNASPSAKRDRPTIPIPVEIVKPPSGMSLSKLFDEIQDLQQTFFSSRMDGIELTRGYLMKAIQKNKDNRLAVPMNPLIQILGIKKLPGQEGRSMNQYRLLVSDGEFSYSYAMLATTLNHLIEENIADEFSVISVDNALYESINNKRIIIIMALEVVAKGNEVGEKLGNPVPWYDEAPAPAPATVVPNVCLGQYISNGDNSQIVDGEGSIDGQDDSSINNTASETEAEKPEYRNPEQIDAAPVASMSAPNIVANAENLYTTLRTSTTPIISCPTPTKPEPKLNVAPVPVPVLKKCNVCGSPSEKKCSACNSVFYCSVDHQKEDWINHKTCCGLFRIEQHPSDVLLGKQWVANRDIEAGEILLDEPAAFYGPWSGADGSTKSPPLCIVCGIYFDVNKKPKGRYYCTKCGWPVCGLECEQNAIHAENECAIFALSHGTNSYRMLEESEFEFMAFSHAITILRGALLEIRNPKLYQEMLKLQHTTRVQDNYLNLILYGLPMTGILKLLQRLEISNTSIEDKLYSKIYRINHLNAFCVSTFDFDFEQPFDAVDSLGGGGHINHLETEAETNLRSKQLVYIKASRLNHSCMPNCSWSIGPAPDFKIRIRTAVSVKKGDPLTIFYSVPPFHTDQEFPTAMRRGFLSSFNGIVCKCARCKDPTELGTFCSAITCASEICKNRCANANANGGDSETETDYGYMLPLQPLITGPESPWQCNKCSEIKPFSFMEKHQQDITMGEQMEQENHPDRDVIQTYYATREKFSGKVLHENHLFFLNATLTWLRCYRHEINDVAEFSVLRRSLEWVRDCLYFYDRVLPGINSKRAQLHMLLAAILRVKLLRNNTQTTGTNNTETMREAYKLFVYASKEALKYYDKDFIRPRLRSGSGQAELVPASVNFNAHYIRLRMKQVENELGSKITDEPEKIQYENH